LLICQYNLEPFNFCDDAVIVRAVAGRIMALRFTGGRMDRDI
jgi:hypothetical protein